MNAPHLYQRNPDLLPEWGEDAKLVLLDCRRGRRFAVTPALLDMLRHLDRPRTAEDLHIRWVDSPGTGDLDKLLVRLSTAGIVHRCPPGLQGSAPSASPETHDDGWTPYELAVHTQAARGPRPGAQRGDPPPARLRHTEATGTVSLPDGHGAPSRPLTTVLAARRSIRDFAPRPLPFDGLGALLDRAARVRGHLPPLTYQQTQRPAPSGGARHSLEIYLLARDVEALEPGAYHYDPFAHVLHRLAPWSDGLTDLQHRTVVRAAAMPQPPPASFYLASYAARTGWKYRGMALSLIYRDTGCLMQTLCLTATDLRLAACPIGSIDAPVSAPFLQPYRDRLVNVGSFALGLPSPHAPTPPIPSGDGPEDARAV
ncbi:MAG TPA: SagB family peptide dehydrogenase [Streptomyces sp.]|nr:SagB family peptide dehydrogenase [Streptomyces sp.]